MRKKEQQRLRKCKNGSDEHLTFPAEANQKKQQILFYIIFFFLVEAAFTAIYQLHAFTTDDLNTDEMKGLWFTYFFYRVMAPL